MAVGGIEEEETEELIIVKPRNDNRDYRRILLPNCLQVLLISDPETDKAAASMAVRVGSDSDPDGLEGLAHFLEHMLFYASEKYPMEDSYSKYISENGGSTNAFTSSEYTNYYFDVNTDSFEEALDRFAQFFIKPLMSADATMREIKAVDSENQKNLLSDGWRMFQLQKHLSAEGHPYHKFSTGNWDTLEVHPKEKGLDTRVELIKFYEENYSANLMYLVVYGKESLDELQSLVDEKFQEIRNIDRSRFIYPGQPCTSDHLQILVKAVPIKEGHKLNIVWPITPPILHYKNIPTNYLGHLIGHEGEGSVFYILKTLGWATSLSAGGYDYNTEVSFFQVFISLTDAGQEHMEDIIGLLFKYIAIIQESGINKWIFDELSVISETGFHFRDKSPPISYVVGVTSNMLFYPPKDWLVASSLPSNFSPDTIQMVLNELTPNNVRIFWDSKKFDGHTEMVEPWYGTAFSLEKIGSSMIQQWVEAAPTEHLRLPVPNIFIPTDLSLKNVPEKAKFPVLLRKSSYLRLWYKADSMFSTPKAYVKIAFNCPYTRHTPEAQVLTDIFTSLLEDYLNEYAYDADVAGLSYGVYSTSTGFQVSVSGYNHKMRILMDKIVEQIAEFKVKPDRFSVIKETVTKGYQNVKFQQPYQQASYYCSLILADQSWPWNEELEVLSHLEAADLEKFTPVLLSKAFLECYVAGNIEPNEAESMILHIENVFFKGPHSICRPLFPSEHLTNRTVKLEKGISHYYSVEAPNQTDENSALVHYIQLHQDDSMLNVKLQLFAFIAKRPFFHQLRSVEQLGYITMLKLRGDSGVRGMSFVIQSTVKDPGQIDLRVEAFLKDFESKLYEMPDDKFKNSLEVFWKRWTLDVEAIIGTFSTKLEALDVRCGGYYRNFFDKKPQDLKVTYVIESNVNSLVEMKLEKFKNLWEECSFYWGEIVAGTFKFNRIESEIAELKRLSQQELIDYFNDNIKVGAPMKKTLSVHVYGGLHSAEYKAIKSETSKPNTFIIDDIFSFRRSRPLYSSSKNGIGHMAL